MSRERGGRNRHFPVAPATLAAHRVCNGKQVMRPCLAAILMLLACASRAGAAPRVVIEGQVRTGEYAAVVVEGARPGQHELAGENVMPVRWPGGAKVVLPVLAYPGGGAAGDAAFTLDGRPVAPELGDADRRWPWVADGPALGVIDARAYAATAGWRPGRPLAERLSVVAAATAFVGLVAAALRLVDRPGRRLVALLSISLAATAGVLAWDRLRPALAVRQCEVAYDGGVDSWYFAACPASADGPQTLRVAVVGETRPVAFSRRHLELLKPTLTCDAAGRPVELTLTLPPGTQAAVVQRLGGHASLPPPLWARPLVRAVYGR